MNSPVISVDLKNYLGRDQEQEKLLRSLFRVTAALTVFDIGACEGEDSIRYSMRFPNARIFSFEPLPTNQELIRINLAKHNIPSAELIPVALSNQEGHALFHVSSGEPQEQFCGDEWNYGNKSSSLLPPIGKEPMHGWIEFKETISVPTSTLKTFCMERKINRIDFIHMDVQGAELMVLEGAGPKIHDVTAVWLEVADQALYQGQPLRQQTQKFMRSHQFTLVFERLNHPEGDQFYVNLRHPRVWHFLIQHRLLSFIRQSRFIAGRWKHRLCRFWSREG